MEIVFDHSPRKSGSNSTLGQQSNSLPNALRGTVMDSFTSVNVLCSLNILSSVSYLRVYTLTEAH